ncbi:hypothetical protein LEP1GSC038_3239 [Leptospira weilii str. 2006001855]|uniref:Uncharacterized protein n=1 Tax=Leptospira weilii str. 2006001855 TaxID=996804 RepID=M6FQQ8_9LEPT|nr:hypothetical protein LEP1GSC051_3555 [Leptospira sp. P2653]EMM72474.1 hypothetical protein LEP1GSC038_3239 [Leptospira weilii str. 2006001855]EMN43497.1 hypothetical protein LEP1GSC086_0499 [Leptospira weilii str. LNT 1234]
MGFYLDRKMKSIFVETGVPLQFGHSFLYFRFRLKKSKKFSSV